MNTHTNFNRANSFRSRKVKINHNWYFEVLDSYTPKHHVVVEEFNGTVDDLFKVLEVWAQKPLHVADDEPQFEFALIKNKAKNGPSAIIARINHAIGDGIALARLIPYVCYGSGVQVFLQVSLY